MGKKQPNYPPPNFSYLSKSVKKAVNNLIESAAKITAERLSRDIQRINKIPASNGPEFLPNFPCIKTPKEYTMDKRQDNRDQIGMEGKDTVTGFKGTITGVVTYLTGCDQFVITPKYNKKNGQENSRWFDVNRVVVNEKKGKIVIVDKNADAKDRGPGETPPEAMEGRPI